MTGIGGNTAQGVARSLRKFPSEFAVIGSDSDRYNVRFGLTYAERVYLVPKAEADDYIDAISRIVDKEKLDMIIPSPDREVYAIWKHRKELGAVVLLQDHSVIEIAQDKWLTYKALEGKVPQPASVLIEGYDDLQRAFSSIDKPIWMRRRNGAGGSGSFIAESLEDARFWVEYWRGYGDFIASKMLHGRNLGWIGLYKDGELISSGGYHRLRYFSARVSPSGVMGNISVGMTIHDNQLNAAALARRCNGFTEKWIL